MKHLAMLLGIALLAGFAGADEAGAAAILQMLNTRTSGSPRAYAAATATVAADARRGSLLQQYLVAVLAGDEDLPASARLTEEERRTFLERSRPRIRAWAEKNNNALAWYLLYLDNHDPAALEKAVAGSNVQALNAQGTRLLMAILDKPPAERTEEDAATMKQCFEYFKRAADRDDANGQNNLGLCYQNGFGCEKDEAAAFACFSKAAKQGHSEAVNNLGRFYREGIVTQQDYAVALRCFRLSAGQGNFWGQVNYALALLRGEGTEPNPALGVELLESIAARGRPEAMDCLAECYAKGLGALKADAMKSAVWAVRARAARGDKNAAAWLEETGNATTTTKHQELRTKHYL